ncbi:MAG: hypothetical protein WC694_01725 [Candidatus Paceibacterota bacterium]|jgi:hypothetical protein
MAEAKVGPSIEVSIFNFIKESWLWIIVIILGYFVWKYNAVIGVLALAGTIFLGWLAWKLWLHYVQQDFISGIDYVLLEIVPPREVLRSPKAMELFFTNALYHWSIKGGKEEWWQGAVWLWFSLEIVSLEGQVHFYIRTPTRIKDLIETQMYAQYPQAQVKVVEDYTLAVDDISPKSSWNGWGCEFKLTKHQAYPIKTYVDFGLDKDPKEEFKVDPISPVVEFFGSLKKGEQAWIQIVITPKPSTDNVPHSWVEESKKEIFNILKPFTAVKDEGARIEIRTPDVYKNMVTAISAKTSKVGFETGVRIMYIAKKEVYDMSNRRNMRLLFRQYAKPDCNEFYRINSAQADFYSGIFSASAETVMMLANRMLHEYRERAFFHLPLRHHLFSKHVWKWPLDSVINAYAHHDTYVLNVEELATIWHFPGQILKVPTLERIESKEASPPTNLPI